MYLEVKCCNRIQYVVIIYYFLHGRWRLTIWVPIFASLYHLFCSSKNDQRRPCACVLHKRCSSKCCKIYRKTRVLESVFNKVKLATLLKKTLTQVFSCEFFEIIKGDFFIKHIRASSSECWQLAKSSWLLVKHIIFQTSEVSHFEW